MEIRLIFFKEIVGVISLKMGLISRYEKHLRSREEKSRRIFFLPKVSLISILQKFSYNRAVDPSATQNPDDTGTQKSSTDVSDRTREAAARRSVWAMKGGK